MLGLGDDVTNQDHQRGQRPKKLKAVKLFHRSAGPLKCLVARRRAGPGRTDHEGDDD